MYVPIAQIKVKTLAPKFFKHGKQIQKVVLSSGICNNHQKCNYLISGIVKIYFICIFNINLAVNLSNLFELIGIFGCVKNAIKFRHLVCKLLKMNW